MKAIQKFSYGIIQNISVMSLALIMVMASFGGTIENTMNVTQHEGAQVLSTGTDYSAFPDEDPDSGKFLGVAGSGTLVNVPIICHIGVPADEDSFEVDIFDGDLGGHWDQYYDNSDYMDFKLYEDPKKDGTGTSLVASWTHSVMSDDNWYHRVFNTTSGAKALSGNYFYRMTVQWRSPGTSSSNNYFKIRTTGQISVAKGNQFALMAGPLRIPYPSNYGPKPWESKNLDPPEWAGDSDPDTNNVDANSYDGDWNFYFYVPKTRNMVSFKDGDADIVVDDDDANTPFPEGISHGAPKDGPSPYNGCDVAPNVKYTITDPDGNSYVNSNPSGNLEWENFIISKDSADNPDHLVSYDLSAGLWNMHIQGLDSHNMYFIEASFEIFTTTKPPLPVSPPPTLVPPLAASVSPGTNVNYAHKLTNKGLSDVFDLSAISSRGWTTRIYHDADGDGALDSSEVTAGEISDTGTLAKDEAFDMIVQVEVPSSSKDAIDYTKVTGASQTEWNIQASLTDTTTVKSNQPPVADANGPYFGDEGSTIQLDGSGTQDPDGDYLWYFWDLDNDGYYDDSTDIKPKYFWGEDGIYPVKLAVYDGEVYDFNSTTVYVGNLAPEIYSTSYVYTLTQGSNSWTIPAVESTLSPKDFYNYYSASAHTGFEIPYQSFLYLYRDIDDPSNEVGLFIIHDIDGDIGPPYGSPDAQCWMDLSGIPSGTYLAQSDDPGEFKINYPSAGKARGRWHWWYNTDGGAIGGLSTTSSWAITIEPLFWDDVSTWAYYYAGGSNINLNMNQPITISYSAQTEPTTVSTNEGTSITLGAFARDWGLDDEPLGYKFYWNDPYDPGASSTGSTPWDTLFTASHTYYENGAYSPQLTVTDSDGATDTLTFTVNVANVAPNVDAGSNQVVNEGTPVSVSGTFSDPGAYDSHSATWSWGDSNTSPGSVSEENIPPYSTGTVSGSHIYMDQGTYIVILTVTDDDGDSGKDRLTVTVLDLAPTAEFSWSPPLPDEGKPVQFTDLSFSYPDLLSSWAWDFGGLGTSISQNPKFIFMDDGTYTVYLTVTDDDGSTDSISHDIEILDLAPIANFSWSPDPRYEGSPVQFTDLSYSYPDAIVSWDWKFGDGGTSTFQNPSHTYGDNGDYNVTLTVKDDDGSVSVITYTVTILNADPIVNAGNDQSTYEGTSVSFSGAFTDPGWLDTHTIEWDFGDGGKAYGTLTPTHTYGDNGDFVVTLKITDDDGGVGYDYLTVHVENVPPMVSPADDQVIDEGTTISLVVATFVDVGWLDTHTATIDWGDGTNDAGSVTETNGSGSVSGSHTYGDNGVYTVTVTVTDDDGGEGSAQFNITVNNLAPEVEPLEPVIIDEGAPFTLTGIAEDPGSDDLTFTWKFEFGPTLVTIYYNNGLTPDPYPSSWGAFPFAATDVVTHTYGDNGNYTVTLTVEDDDGAKIVVTTYVIVNNVAPSVDLGGPYIVNENSPLVLNGHATDPGSDDLTFSWVIEYGPIVTTIYYNDGENPDPFPSPEVNPRDIIDNVAHTYGDNGVFTVTLTVTDDDGATTTVTVNVTVNNVAPTVVNLEAYMYVNFSLRVAGEKWHSVGILLLEDDKQIWADTITRYPGSPDEQMATKANVKVDMTKSYTALVDYLPNDPRVNGNVWGGNPVWIIMTFEDGSETRLHHTFNVRQSDWNSDHWNHIDPWEVEFAPYLGGHNITFEAHAEDPGSDDLTFFWNFDDGNFSGPNIYYNNGLSPDPFPSTEINPMTATETTVHRYATSGTYTITLTVTDDDGGTVTVTLSLAVVVG
ncbi:MAG: PKD domain-containing protein [Thermoplasmata archaeon]|nr:MAG: PKD domain-containing protein [Thermoplasmata archaeon]